MLQAIRPVTYEIHYAPSVASISDGAKISAMESGLAEIEKQLGVLQPSPYPVRSHQGCAFSQC